MLRADLHIHTNYSDGRDSVRKILEAAIAKNLDIIAITDHNTMQGSLEAMNIVKEEHLPIIVLPGVEISAKEGHVLVYGIKNEVEPGISIKEISKIVKKREGVLALAHPFNFLRKGVFNPFKFVDHIDAIEVFNAKSYIGVTNIFSRCLCNKYGKTMIAGSDAHSAEMVGYGITFFNGTRSIAQILNDIRNGKTSIGGRRIPLLLQIKYTKSKVIKW